LFHGYDRRWLLIKLYRAELSGDVNALAGAMIDCLAAPADLLARMGEAAHDRVLARHDADTEAAKLAGLFAASTAARAVPRPATAEAEAR